MADEQESAATYRAAAQRADAAIANALDVLQQQEQQRQARNAATQQAAAERADEAIADAEALVRRQERQRQAAAHRREQESKQETEARQQQVRERANERRDQETKQETEARLEQVRGHRANESKEGGDARRELDRLRSGNRSRASLFAARQELRKKTFFDNLNEPDVKKRNPYYYNEHFPPSINEFDWTKAEDSILFSYRKHRMHQSLQFYWSEQCGCGARYLNKTPQSFQQKCCHFPGSQKVPGFAPLISAMQTMVDENPQHLQDTALHYNNKLAFAVVGVENDKQGGYVPLGPDASVTMQGQTYHYVPTQDDNKITTTLGYLFFGIPPSQSTSPITEFMDPDVVDRLLDCMRQENAYAAQFDSICDVLNDQGESNTVYEVEVNGTNTLLEVSVIRNDSAGTRVLRCYPKNNNGRSQKFNLDQEHAEPLAYPLLFTQGEPGWHKNLGVSKKAYLASMILRCDGLNMPSKLFGHHHIINTNRIQLFSRLGQTYVLDQVSGMIDNQLNFIRKHQNMIFGKNEEGGEADEDEADEEENDIDHPTTNRSSYLPKSVTGSPRHMRLKALNALYVVSAVGGPTEFVTLTTDVKWREIQEQLLEGQTAFERMDVTNRVFHAKLMGFLANLRNGVYHNGTVVDGEYVPNPRQSKQCVYIMYVIEYQQRGLPHAHIVYRTVDEQPTPTTPLTPEELTARQEITRQRIDGYETNEDGRTVRHLPEIQAYAPARINKPSAECTPDEEAEKLLFALVHENNIHHCAVASNGCKDTATSLCKRGYDTTQVHPTTTFSEKNKPIYGRPTADALKVVPYKATMMLDWCGHLNVESANNEKSVVYLYDYLYKGIKKILAQIRKKQAEAGVANPDQVDEVTEYVRGRVMSAMSCCNRVFGFPDYPKHEPTCIPITIKTFEQMTYFLQKEHKMSDMAAYMYRPAHLHGMTICVFFQQYHYSYKQPSRGEYHTIQVPSIPKQVYIIKWIIQTVRLIRINMVFPHNGEIYYLRTILRNRPVISQDDAYTCNGVKHSSLQACAKASGYLTDETEGENVFNEAVLSASFTPNGLRGLFAMLTVDGHPTLGILTVDVNIEAMTSDFEGNEEEKYRLMLVDLKRKLASHNKTLADYHLDKHPITGLIVRWNSLTELEETQERVTHGDALTKYNELNSQYPNNALQEAFMAEFKETFEDESEQEGPRFFCLHGQGGTGKSVLLQKIQLYVQAAGKIPVMCASTNLAALAFENCLTAYSTFGYPVLEDHDVNDAVEQVQCKPTPERLELLLNCSLIIWDEFLQNHHDVLDAAVELVKANKQLIIITGADGRQCPPVVPFGTAKETILASMQSSRHWPLFKVRFLLDNMRLTALTQLANLTAEQQALIDAQNRYRKILDAIGEDKETDVVTTIKRVQTSLEINTTLELQSISHESNSDEGIQHAIAFLYPNGLPTAQQYENNQELPSKSILCLYNDDVDTWNTRLQEMNNEQSHVLTSKDIFADVDDEHGYLKTMLTTAVRRDFTNTDVPNYELTLKVNDICLVTRNLNSLRLPSNSRVRIIRINQYSIIVKTMDTEKRTVVIPRIKFKFRLKYASSFSLIRVQFPLRLAYAITVHRSQSQSIDFVVLDLTKPAFGHGQLYTAFSRLRQADRLMVIVDPTTQPPEIGEDKFHINNIIYPQLILQPEEE